jgi:hypothetical protein
MTASRRARAHLVPLSMVCMFIAAGCERGVTHEMIAPDITHPPNTIRLESEAGDPVAGGNAYQYTQTNSLIRVERVGYNGFVQVEINGDEWWHGCFQLPDAIDQFRPGSYSGLQRHSCRPNHDLVIGGLSWHGGPNFVGCNTLNGAIHVDSATYVGYDMRALHFRFVQHCEGNAAALRGTVHWRADDTTLPPGPVQPIPELWAPDAQAMPGGNYLYIVSEVGDAVGEGLTYLYDDANAAFSVSTYGRRLMVVVESDVIWDGFFEQMLPLPLLEPGYSGDLGSWPTHNPAKGGLSWRKRHVSCERVTGWVAVDAVRYSGPELSEIALRFEQHCQGSAGRLRGALVWRIAS